jgi:hypothetical protein
MYRKPKFTDDELAARVWDKEEIKDLMARHAYYQSADRRREELNDLWVKKADNKRSASLAYNYGYFVGMDEIVRHYVFDLTELRYRHLQEYCDADPSIARNDLNLGLGLMMFHTSTTPMLYLADDGKTARYLAYDCAQQVTGKPDGDADGYMLFGLVFADLIKEDGEWKIWHLIMRNDHTMRIGEDYEQVPVLPWDDPLREEYGTATIARTVYDPLYGWETLYQDMPKMYDTYDEASGYGPNSDMGYRYFEREGWVDE